MSKPRSGAIPFASLFLGDVDKRNARMALRDPTTPPLLRREIERYLADPNKATLTDMQKLLDDRAVFRSGRPAGSQSAKVRYIEKLVAANPKRTAKQLFKLADKAKIGDMQDGTFKNHVGAARRKLRCTV